MLDRILLNRRRLLSGLAAASTAAATGTAALASVPNENPELLRLADELPAVDAEHSAAVAARRAILDQWEPLWPVAPEALTVSGGSDLERGLTGAALNVRQNQWGELRARSIWTTESLDWHLDLARRVLKGRSVDRQKVRGMTRTEWESELADYEHLHRIAARYEAKCAKVRKASGYAPAEARTTAALDALLALLAAIMAQEETTMAGVVVKAQALTAWGRLHCVDGVRLGALQWGPQLAEAIMRLSTANAAEG